jgi:hypothetical protein
MNQGNGRGNDGDSRFLSGQNSVATSLFMCELICIVSVTRYTSVGPADFVREKSYHAARGAL